MEKLLNAIQETVKREGIDLLGFAPKSRFEALEANKTLFQFFLREKP